MHTIELTAADPYRTTEYGVLLVSVTRHYVSGPRVHNPAFPHRVDVWENRPSRATGADPDQKVDPRTGQPTDEPYTYLLTAQPVAVTAWRQDLPPEGKPLAIGDIVTLAVNGYGLGAFRIEAGMLSDPILVPLVEVPA